MSDNLSFTDKLAKRVASVNSLLCVGIDPQKQLFADVSDVSEVQQFCIRIIDSTHPFVAAFKPNIAFFERFGAHGMEALKTVIAGIPQNIPVILDCKRGDIHSTAEAYADASYEYILADSVTVNPYMGWDSVRPFVTGQYAHKFAWVLCKTSNTSSSDLQSVTTQDGLPLFMKVAALCNEWNTAAGAEMHPVIGLVAGATDIDAMTAIRQACKDAWILCPGVGTQGGDIQRACEAGLRTDGSGLLVSISRAIHGAADMAEAARRIRDEINSARQQALNRADAAVPTAVVNLQPHQREFIDLAVACNALQFGSFTLKSGRVSPYFFNAGLINTGDSLHVLGRCYATAIEIAGLAFDVLFGPAYKGIALATAVSVALVGHGQSVGVCYNRKEVKEHGEGGSLVGATVAGRRVLIVDDVITAGTAIREAMRLLSSAGAHVVGVVVCLDRQECTSVADSVQESAAAAPLSAVSQVEQEFSVPVLSVASLDHLVGYTTAAAAAASVDANSVEGEANRQRAAQMEEYRRKYAFRA